ncbi:MAG: hypothetical protein WAU84_14720, partial [Thermoguttaceae bacterium]
QLNCHPNIVASLRRALAKTAVARTTYARLQCDFLRFGMTVSASIPLAVLSITLFRAFSRGFGRLLGAIDSPAATWERDF